MYLATTAVALSVYSYSDMLMVYDLYIAVAAVRGTAHPPDEATTSTAAVTQPVKLLMRRTPGITDTDKPTVAAVASSTSTGEVDSLSRRSPVLSPTSVTPSGERTAAVLAGLSMDDGPSSRGARSRATRGGGGGGRTGRSKPVPATKPGSAAALAQAVATTATKNDDDNDDADEQSTSVNDDKPSSGGGRGGRGGRANRARGPAWRVRRDQRAAGSSSAASNDD
jgi:hypothetical protein